MTVTVRVKLEKVDGRKLSFSVAADDGIDKISEGTHERFVIDAAKVQQQAGGENRAGRRRVSPGRSRVSVRLSFSQNQKPR